MATTNRVYIFAAFILSAISAIFNIISLSTEKWITGKAVTSDGNDANYVNYGLFQGNYIRNVPSSSIYQLLITCNFGNNVCAMLCGLDTDDRQSALNEIYNNTGNATLMSKCPTVTSYTYNMRSFENRPVLTYASAYDSSGNFINAGAWLCTVVFLILAILAGSAASILSLYNAVTNPIYYFLSVKSLFMYNGIAFFCTVLYLALWGTMYNIIIFHNISIIDTLIESLSSDKMAYLGYSYWIGLIPLVFYVASISILYFREYLNERDPKQQKVTLDSDAADPSLFLY